MKLKDFLKQFENEDPETEICQTTHDMWRDLQKDVDITNYFVSPDEFGKELMSNWTYARKDDSQIKVIRIG